MKNSHTALSYALWLLGRKDYSAAEISEKIQKRYNKEEADECLIFLVEKKFVDDERFARNYVRIFSGSRGRHYIENKLKEKKVAANIIAQELDQISEVEQFESAKEYGLKYSAKHKDDKNIYQKTGGFLARRGYNFEIIKKVLAEIL